MTQRHGFDDAVVNQADDQLGRLAFAREVAHILCEAPADWSVRVGVYGPWGTGKTSVLNLCRALLDAKGHVVVDFSVWGCESQRAMWAQFAEALQAKLQDEGIADAELKRSALKARLGRLVDRIKPLAEADPRASALTNSLARILGIEQLQLHEAMAALDEDNRRLVVMIDDVDRADPKLVPDLLFMVKELMSLPGINYVLALDPEAVGNALNEYHSGWKSGSRFLEKIIDFPRWLPEPHPQEIKRLVASDLRDLCPFVPVGVVEQEADVLPRAPRVARAFVRQLWSLQGEAERYGPNELNWALLTRIAMLKATAPKLFSQIARDSTLVKDVCLWNILDEERDKRRADLKARLEILQAEGEERAADAVRLVLRIGESTSLVSPERFIHHAFLAERPRGVTHKEYDACLENENLSEDTIRTWMQEHQGKYQLDTKRVVRGLWTLSIERAQDAASELRELLTEEGRNRARTMARKQMEIARVAAIDLGGFVGEPPVLAAGDFAPLVALLVDWSRSRGDLFAEEQAQAQSLFDEVVAQTTLDPLQLLDIMSPLRGERIDSDESLTTVRAMAVEALAERASDQVFTMFSIAERIAEVTRHARWEGARYLLFRRSSPAWAPDKREGFREVCRCARTLDVEMDNLIRFLDVVVGGKNKHMDVESTELEALAADADIVVPAWQAVTARPLTEQASDLLARFRAGIKQHTGSEPPRPEARQNCEYAGYDAP